MIAIAAVVPDQVRDDSCAPSVDYSAECAAAASEVTRIAATLAACGKCCLDVGLIDHASEKNTIRSAAIGDVLLASSEFCPAARHGVCFWLCHCLRDPNWYSVQLPRLRNTLMNLLKAYSKHPRSQRDVFEALKLVIHGAKNTSSTSDFRGGVKIDTTHVFTLNKRELSETCRAAILALAKLAAISHEVLEILNFIEHAECINELEALHFLNCLSHRVLTPFSLLFAESLAAFFSCQKAKRAMQKLDSVPYEHQVAVYDLICGLVCVLDVQFTHYAYLLQLKCQFGAGRAAQKARGVGPQQPEFGNRTFTH